MMDEPIFTSEELDAEAELARARRKAEDARLALDRKRASAAASGDMEAALAVMTPEERAAVIQRIRRGLAREPRPVTYRRPAKAEKAKRRSKAKSARAARKRNRR